MWQSPQSRVCVRIFLSKFRSFRSLVRKPIFFLNVLHIHILHFRIPSNQAVEEVKTSPLGQLCEYLRIIQQKNSVEIALLMLVNNLFKIRVYTIAWCSVQ